VLILTRTRGESVVMRIGDVKIIVKVCQVKEGQVRLGFDAPPTRVKILREELEDFEEITPPPNVPKFGDLDYDGPPPETEVK
jgi:carbon storage regulator CsrA